MKTMYGWMFNLLQLIGISAFLGSILAMIVLGRTHDFSLNWNEILTSRTDILRIILFVNPPGLLIYLLVDFYKYRKLIFKSKMITLKWFLNLSVLCLTTLVILSASIQMVQTAKEAQRDLFLTYHVQEDIWGPVNMLIFLISLGIGVRQKEKSTKLT
jgi:hypothetical protein